MPEEYIGVKFKTIFAGKYIPTAEHLRLIDELIEVGRQFKVLGTDDKNGGNISARVSEGLVIKRTGSYPYELKREDFVLVTAATNDTVTVQGAYEPSSEARLHYRVYQARPDVGAILHTHDLKVVGGAARFPEVAYLPQISYGTLESAIAVSEAAQFHDYLVLDGHGVISLGKNIKEAMDRIIYYHGRIN